MSTHFFVTLKERLVLCIILIVVSVMFSFSAVSAVGPDSNKPYILINPYLSASSMANGDTLYIKAEVYSNFPVVRGVARIEGFNTQVPFKLVQGDGKAGFWVAEWVGNGLQNKHYQVFVTFTDNTGHSYTPAAVQFSDPIAGNDTRGYEQAGMYGIISGVHVNIPEEVSVINSFNIYTSPGTYRVALYDKDKNLLWQSFDVSFNKEGWQEIRLENGTPNRVGTLKKGDYWFAIQSMDKESSLYYTKTEGTISGFEQRYLYNAFPQRIAKESMTQYQLSAYIVYNEEYIFIKKVAQRIVSSLRRII